MSVAWVSNLLLGPILLAGEPSSIGNGEYAARRDAVCDAVRKDAFAVVFAESSASHDLRAPQIDPSFRYLTGVLEPQAIVVLQRGDDSCTQTLYLPGRNRSRERWSGMRPGAGAVDPATGEPDDDRRHAIEATGFERIRRIDRFDRDLTGALAGGKRLHIVTPRTALKAPLGRELELIRDARDRRPQLEVSDLTPLLTELRSVKSEAEIGLIERAIAITVDAHREVATLALPGHYEYELIARLEYVFRRSGASGPSFPSIVGSGPNSTILHYEGDHRQLEAGELVLVDIGARYDGYAADLTRTYPVGGRFSERQREIYDLVLRAQDAAIRAVKPGAKLRSDVHAAAKRVIEEAGFAKQFPHGTSHFVGLEVHDIRARDPELKPGMVLTVEPGVYLPDEGFGVRIEDMLVVTKRGARMLSRALPRSADEMEALVSASRAADRTAERTRSAERRLNGRTEQHDIKGEP